MPLTVITLTKVPPSLRGDLTKWMQEVNVGVYVGNFNVKIRDHLWKRITQNINGGQATMSYACRNELGYDIKTYNSRQNIIYSDGIPLVQIPRNSRNYSESKRMIKSGYSNAAKIRKLQKMSNKTSVNKSTFVVIDIETDGLDENKNHILELGALKIKHDGIEEFDRLIVSSDIVPTSIQKLTGIDQALLDDNGMELKKALKEFISFIKGYVLVGYSVNFDINFINHYLRLSGMNQLSNNYIDLLSLVKKEKIFLLNYKLQTVLKDYEIYDIVPHRALQDCKIIEKLSTKVNGFAKMLKDKC